MKFFCNVALCLFALPLSATAQQYRLEPLTSDLLCVATNGQRIAAAGTNGVVMLSDDAGATWRQEYLPEPAVVTDVVFSRTGMALAVIADASACYLSTTGGASWQRILLPDSAGAIGFAANDILYCGGFSGALYRKTVAAPEWEQLGNLNSRITDIAELAPDSIGVLTDFALHLVAGTTVSKLTDISILSAIATPSPLHRAPDGRWGFSTGGKLYYTDSSVVRWQSFVPDTAANVLFLQRGLRAAVLRRQRWNDGGRLYVVATYSIADRQHISAVNLDSVYSPRADYARTWLPLVTSVQTLDNGSVIVIGIDKMMYMLGTDGIWKQICLLTDIPSQQLGSSELSPKFYFSMGMFNNRITLGTLSGASSVVFMQSSDQGVLWKTPQKDWGEIIQSQHNSSNLSASSNSHGKVIVLQHDVIRHQFLRSDDTLQSFQRILTDTSFYTKSISPSIPNCRPTLLYLGNGSWFVTHSFMKGNWIDMNAWESKIRSVWGRSVDSGDTWSFTFRDSIAFGDLCQLSGESFLVPVKFPDSSYLDTATREFMTQSGGCELWKSDDFLATHETIPQPGVHAFDRLHMFDANHGVAYIIYNLPAHQKTAAFAETFDGGKTWKVFDSTRRPGSKHQAYSRSDGGTYVMYEHHYTPEGMQKSNRVYVWRRNGKERKAFIVPTDHSFVFPVSADTMLYAIPGELYRMILSPNTSVEEPRIDDYETSVFLQSPYPNPAASTVQIPLWYYAATVRPDEISVVCYDLSGAKVADLTRRLKLVSGGQMIVEWDMSALPSGVYIVRCQSATRRGNARIVIKQGGE